MSTIVDVLFVNCHSAPQVYQGLADSKTVSIEPPFWAGLLANFMRARNYSVDILDAEALGLTHEETALKILDYKALLTVFVVYGHQPSASTQCMPAAINVHYLVKEGNGGLQTMFMGTHASALPEKTLSETNCNFVCYGEGPHTVLGVIECLKSGTHDYSKVHSLCYRELGICKTERGDLIRSLDSELPSVAWDLLPMDKYRASNWHCLGEENRQPYASLYTSLGCNFKCQFCCINAPFGRATIRYVSPECVIKEIDILVEKYSIKHIKIPDEMFVLHRHHVIGICDQIIERGYDLNIWAYARIDTIQDDFLSKLKQAGFNWLALGIESANSKVRDGQLKKLDDQDIVDTVRKIREHGINVIGNYIFGLPEETQESMQQTLDLANNMQTEWANFYCCQCYPGSPLHEMSVKRGLELPETHGPGWIGYSQHAYESFPARAESLSRSQILKFRDEAHCKYFSNESYLSMIKGKFGASVADNVKESNKLMLHRRY